jgi:hypothetical protein
MYFLSGLDNPAWVDGFIRYVEAFLSRYLSLLKTWPGPNSFAHLNGLA